MRSWGALLALMLGAAALASACGKSRGRLPLQAAGGEGGGCLECGGEAGAAGAPVVDQGDSGAAGSAQGGAPSAGGTPGGEAGAPIAPAPSLTLGSISISQSLEIQLMQAGQPVAEAMRSVPLVAGKRALLRAFVELEPGFQARPLMAVLDLVSPSGDDTLVSERQIAASSTQDDLVTTFVFDVQARDLEVATNYRVRVLETDTTPIARFPESGYTPLLAKKREAFKLVLVPMIANGYAPQTGEAELVGLRARMQALFPSTSVQVTVAAPVTLPYTVNGDYDGWDDALEDLYDLRALAAPPHDVFYYGMLAPDASYDSYCNASSCIIGYSNLAEADDEDSRGSIGITVFEDGSGAVDAWDTLAHELGHAMGRDHSFCGVEPDDTDPDYPYDNGGLGTVYGFDFDSMELVKPRQVRDIMGYCAPYWISDYTYRGLFDRLDYIAGEGFRVLSLSPPELFRVARVDLKGRSSWRRDRFQSRSVGKYQAVDVLDAAGRPIGSVDARIVRRDHSSGGLVWLPAAALAQSGAAAVDLGVLGGMPLPL